MANLIVRNVDDAIVKALKEFAGKSGNSVEAEHRIILSRILLKPEKKPFAEILMQIPNVGNDSDFERL
ncbi:MAG: DNA-binding protein [Proteobacteria bacterium]|nr:DNA-binding protein [Pseudomonadota bacterium]